MTGLRNELVILLVVLLDNRPAGRGISADAASGLYSRSATVQSGCEPR
jgi:hypothetical protein